MPSRLLKTPGRLLENWEMCVATWKSGASAPRMGIKIETSLFSSMSWNLTDKPPSTMSRLTQRILKRLEDLDH